MSYGLKGRVKIAVIFGAIILVFEFVIALIGFVRDTVLK